MGRLACRSPCGVLLLGRGRPRDRPAPRDPPPRPHRPVLAYYYIWFDPSSWNRAKTDCPLLGPLLERRRRRDAPARPLGEAGGHRRLPRELEAHADARPAAGAARRVAAEEHFGLGDHLPGPRLPPPAAPGRPRRRTTSTTSPRRYADGPRLPALRQPLVVWSGTWEFSPSRDRARSPLRVRDRLSILASERNVAATRASPPRRRRRVLLVVGQPGHYPGYLEQAGRDGPRPSTPTAGSGSRRPRPASTPA